MIVYLDASALVKRYIEEAGSAAVGRLVDLNTCGRITMSQVEEGSAKERDNEYR